MSLSFVLFIAVLAVLLALLFLRAGKKRGKNGEGGGSSDDGSIFDSGHHCDDSGTGDCGGDGGGD